MILPESILLSRVHEGKAVEQKSETSRNDAKMKAVLIVFIDEKLKISD
jgi:hypothetical protein